MTDHRPVALFDLDGTLADFDGAMLAALRRMASPAELVTGDWRWPGQDDEPAHLRERRRAVKARPGFWAGLSPLPLGLRLLGTAEGLGYEVRVLSHAPAREHAAWGEKLAWCDRHLAQVRDRATRTGRPPVTLVDSGDGKAGVRGDLLVDDWPPYVLPWLEAHPGGWAVVPGHEGNVGFSHRRAVRCSAVDPGSVAEAEAVMRAVIRGGR